MFETNVYLEIANSEGTHITLRRSTNEERTSLITVWEGHAISGGFEQQESKDFFVRMEGASVRERGFHHYLATFMGLDLPQVLKYDGGHSPLYLEALFSLYYVEQTRGWGGIQNVLPTYLGIQQMAQRVIEFTLALDAQEIIEKRQAYLSQREDLEQVWSLKVTQL